MIRLEEKDLRDCGASVVKRESVEVGIGRGMVQGRLYRL